MNKSLYRIIFNPKHGCKIVVSEHTKHKHKNCANTNSGSISVEAKRNTKRNNSMALQADTFSISLLNFSLFLALAAVNIVQAQGIIVDKTAPKNQQATILQSTNGTPQINIQTPTQAGVSINQYQQFDVNAKGAILNNSRTHTPTQLGGWIQANPWLATGEAKVIVNQVNSLQPSLLNGYIEIGGKRAEVVITNPAGIHVDGAGFINASRATLSTALPQFQAAKHINFPVRSAQVQISGQGLDTRHTDYTRILSQTAQINAPIWGQDVQIITGQNDVASSGDSYTAIATDLPNTIPAQQQAPLFAIDTGVLGGMYANKITLISTNPNATVRNQGQIFASVDNVVIDANGKLINSGTIAANPTQNNNNTNEHKVNIRSQSLENSGTIAAQQHNQINSPSIHNTGTIFSSGELLINNAQTLSNAANSHLQAARLAIQTQQLDNAGQISQTGTQKLQITAQGNMDNRGHIGLPNTTPTASNTTGGNTTNNSHHTSLHSATAAPTTATGLGSTTITPSSSHSTPASFADGFIQTQGTFQNSGSIIANGQTHILAQQGLYNAGQIDIHQLEVKGSAFNNHNGTVISDNAHIQTEHLNNPNSTIATQQLTIETTQLDNSSGTLQSTDTLQLNISGSLNNQNGQIAANQQLSINDAQNTLAIDNSKGIIQSGNTSTIQAKSLTNTGILFANTKLDIALQDDFNVEHDISAGQELLISTQGNLKNTHAIQASSKVKLHAHNLHNIGNINSNGLTHIEANQELLNIGTGTIYGNHIALAADSLNNKEAIIGTDTKAAIVAARERLDIGARNINNQEAAILSSEGDLAIGAYLDTNQQAIGIADSLSNSSARIEAQGQGKIAVKQLQNVNNHFKVEEYLADKTEQVRDYTVFDQNTYYQAGKEGSFDNSAGKKDQTIANFHLKNGQLISAPKWHVRDYHTEIYKERLIENQPAQMIIGGNLTVSGQTWLNQDSQIIVGATLITDELANGQIINKATLGQGRVEAIGTQWDSTTRKQWYENKKRPRRININHNIYQATNRFTHEFDTPISIVQQNAEVQSNQQTATALHNSSNAATVKFISSNSSTIHLPNNSLYTINPNSQGWLVETDPAFTHYKQWLGSDYMLNALQSDPQNKHKRLGDGYYEQKLINEQINRLTGHRRLDGYSNDEEQFKALMNNGLTASKELGLTPGIALTPEQVARLSSDIVWLETQKLTLADGSSQTVLVPKVYVLARQGDVNISGSLISANQINLNIQNGTLHNSGTIAGRQVVVLNARDINNAGYLQADKIGLTASDNLNFNGGQAQASSALLASANNINFNSTTSSLSDKQNSSTVLDRVAAVYISGNTENKGILALNAQNDLNLNAALINNDAQKRANTTECRQQSQFRHSYH